jgi:opacity protein-like surface antigen
MNKLFFAAMVILLSSYITKAQVADHAIGLRIGGGYGFGTEISYQHGLSSLNRLEFGLGFRNSNDYDGWALTGLYQWVWKIDGGFNWYAGPGAKIGTWNTQNEHSDVNDGFFLAAAGTCGIEYVFPIGIQLAIDARPELGIVNHGSGINLGFSIRYQF